MALGLPVSSFNKISIALNVCNVLIYCYESRLVSHSLRSNIYIVCRPNYIIPHYTHLHYSDITSVIVHIYVFTVNAI